MCVGEIPCGFTFKCKQIFGEKFGSVVQDKLRFETTLILNEIEPMKILIYLTMAKIQCKILNMFFSSNLEAG